MKTSLHIAFFLFASYVSVTLCPLTAQLGVYQITDYVELPSDLKIPGDSACFIKFEETWTFLSKGALMKEVSQVDYSCSGEGKGIPLPGEITRIKDINYEFMLLDPHVIASGNKGFSEPDSMDASTRNLQASLIELVQLYIRIDKDYDPDQQLLSVYFHEEWEVNPEIDKIRKKVKAITPVIWQRRQTAEGRGINDAETGLPVYYKNPLHRIQLRQP